MKIFTFLMLVCLVLAPASFAQQFQATQPLPLPLSRTAAAAVDGTAYLCGGEKGADLELSDLCYAYEVETDQWQTIAPLPLPSANGCGVSNEGYFWIIGGWDGAFALDTLYRYDPADDSWTEQESLPTALFGAACTVFDGAIIATGGWVDQDTAIDTLHVYEDDIWIEGLPTYAPIAYHGVAAIDEAFLLSGGIVDGEPVDKLWRAPPPCGGLDLAPLDIPRAGHKMLTVNQEIWLLGGGDWDSPDNAVRLYDFENDTWSDGPSMISARRSFSALVLPEGVLVAGGFDGTDIIAKAEFIAVDTGAVDDDDDDDDDSDDNTISTDDDDNDSNGCCG